MAGTPSPTALTVHQASRELEISFDDGATFRMPFELMRVYSPSAEVQGHGPGQEVLQTGKREVGITGLEPVGHYALQPGLQRRPRAPASSPGTTCYQLGSRPATPVGRVRKRLAAGARRPDARGGRAACGHHH
jgi:hypothetical protein